MLYIAQTGNATQGALLLAALGSLPRLTPSSMRTPR